MRAGGLSEFKNGNEGGKLDTKEKKRVKEGARDAETSSRSRASMACRYSCLQPAFHAEWWSACANFPLHRLQIVEDLAMAKQWAQLTVELVQPDVASQEGKWFETEREVHMCYRQD